MRSNLNKDYVWNTLGMSANSFISLFLLIVVSNLNAGGDVNDFSNCFPYAIVFYTIGLFGGRVYQLSDVAGEFLSKDYIFVKFFTSALMVAASVLFSLASGFSTAKTLLLLVLVLYKASDALADPVFGVIQRHGAIWITGVSLTLKSVCGFALFLAVDIATRDILAASLCLLLANMLFFFVWDLPRMRRLEHVGSVLKGSFAPGLRLMQKTLWVFLFALLPILLSNIPRYFVDRWHGEGSKEFAYIVMPASLINLFVTVLIFPKLVPLSERFARGEHFSFGKTVTKFFLFSFGFGAVAAFAAWLIGCPVLSFIYHADLAPYRTALTLVVLGATLNAATLICTNILTIMRCFPVQLACYGVGVATAFAASAALVGRYSVTGGIYAFALAYGVQAALFFIAYRHSMAKIAQGPGLE
ncbi:MAG: hypothetical protein LBR44_06790 [Clostridiales Family XIII bacterium]|jgi:O-antigen/teichoic acid export membrane protein|nr:hypothetical protein [Clostridiales Family XIII bacterium]